MCLNPNCKKLLETCWSNKILVIVDCWQVFAEWMEISEEVAQKVFFELRFSVVCLACAKPLFLVALFLSITFGRAINVLTDMKNLYMLIKFVRLHGLYKNCHSLYIVAESRQIHDVGFFQATFALFSRGGLTGKFLSASFLLG